MMVLYSGTTCPFSHRCRFVLFEKGMDFEIRDVDLYNKPEDISVMTVSYTHLDVYKRQVVGDATLNRFFSFHVIAVPLVLLGLVVAHIIALHEVGSLNPDGIEIKETKDAKGIPLDGIPFHPYYSVHDIFGVSVFLFVFSAIVFFAPEMGGYFLEYNNFIPANPFQTPLHIAPVWYFTPFYSLLRAVTNELMYVLMACVVVGAALAVTKWKMPALFKAIVVGAAVVVVVMMFTIDAKFWGVVAMGGGVVILFFLPWLDNCPVKSIRYRPDWHLSLIHI